MFKNKRTIKILLTTFTVALVGTGIGIWLKNSEAQTGESSDFILRKEFDKDEEFTMTEDFKQDVDFLR